MRKLLQWYLAYTPLYFTLQTHRQKSQTQLVTVSTHQLPQVWVNTNKLNVAGLFGLTSHRPLFALSLQWFRTQSVTSAWTTDSGVVTRCPIPPSKPSSNVSQSGPFHSCGQRHSWPAARSRQVPPCWQGEVRQSSTVSNSQCSPAVPDGHAQWKDVDVGTHVAPFWHGELSQ